MCGCAGPVPPDLHRWGGTPASVERLEDLQGPRHSPAAAPASPAGRRSPLKHGRVLPGEVAAVSLGQSGCWGGRKARSTEGLPRHPWAELLGRLPAGQAGRDALSAPWGEVSGTGASHGLCVCIAQVVTGRDPQRQRTWPPDHSPRLCPKVLLRHLPVAFTLVLVAPGSSSSLESIFLPGRDPHSEQHVVGGQLPAVLIWLGQMTQCPAPPQRPVAAPHSALSPPPTSWAPLGSTPRRPVLLEGFAGSLERHSLLHPAGLHAAVLEATRWRWWAAQCGCTVKTGLGKPVAGHGLQCLCRPCPAALVPGV